MLGSTQCTLQSPEECCCPPTPTRDWPTPATGTQITFPESIPWCFQGSWLTAPSCSFLETSPLPTERSAYRQGGVSAVGRLCLRLSSHPELLWDQASPALLHPFLSQEHFRGRL